jgi:hypothetical protein
VVRFIAWQASSNRAAPFIAQPFGGLAFGTLAALGAGGAASVILPAGVGARLSRAEHLPHTRADGSSPHDSGG